MDNRFTMTTYAAYAKDDNLRAESSSGGIFSLLARRILAVGGIVYGAAMSDDCYSAEIIGVEDEEGLSRLRGSKYLQARPGGNFKKIKKELLSGRQVLFTGTPCLINGLKSFLQRDYDNLYCADIICHGVPSPKLWKEYVKSIENEHGRVESVSFRCKGAPESADGLYIPKDEDAYMKMFLRDFCLRPSCYECPAKTIRKSDITIGDFWGIENIAPEMNDGRGTSLVIIRTDKGSRLFENIRSEIEYIETPYDESVSNNPSEHSSSKRPKQRDTFFADLDKLSFEQMKDKYAGEDKESIYRKCIRGAKAAIMGLAQGRRDESCSANENSDYGLLFTFRKQ